MCGILLRMLHFKKVGNTIGRELNKKANRPVSHADATSVTEFAIQTDLFQRGTKQMIGNK